MKVLALAVVSFLMAGCANGLIHVDIPEGDVYPAIQKVTEKASFTGMKALCKSPEQAKAYQGNMKIAQEFIRSTAIPLVQNQDLGIITMATANQILEQFDEKLLPEVRIAIQLAIDAGILMADLPDNPAAKLTEQQRSIILAILTGIDNGITKFVAWEWDGQRDMVRPEDTEHLYWKRR